RFRGGGRCCTAPRDRVCRAVLRCFYGGVPGVVLRWACRSTRPGCEGLARGVLCTPFAAWALLLRFRGGGAARLLRAVCRARRGAWWRGGVRAGGGLGACGPTRPGRRGSGRGVRGAGRGGWAPRVRLGGGGLRCFYGRGAGVVLRWACRITRPGCEGLVRGVLRTPFAAWALLLRFRGGGRCCACSYCSGAGSLSLFRRLRERLEDGRFSVVAAGLLRFSMAWPTWASSRVSPLARRRVWRTSLLSCRA